MSVERLRALLSTEWRLVHAAWNRFVDIEAYRLGASLALFGLLSLMPILLLTLGVLQAIIGDSSSARESVAEWFDASSSPEVRALMATTIDGLRFGTEGSVLGVVLGAVGALIGASGVFAELDTALNRVFGSERPLGSWRDALYVFVHDRLWSFLFVALTSLLVLVAGFAGLARDAFAEWSGDHDALRYLTGVATLAVTSLSIAACLRWVPDRWVPWSAAVRGGVVAAVLLLLVRKPFAVLTVRLGGYAAYGAVGSMLAVITWIYVSSMVLLFGASIAAAACERRRPERRPPTLHRRSISALRARRATAV